MNGFERHRHLLDWALAGLWRHRRKTLLWTAAYSFLVFVFTSVLFFAGALEHETRLLLSEAPDLVVQRRVVGRHDLIPETHARRLEGIRGVRSLRPRLWGYYFNPVSGGNYTLMVPPDTTFADDRAVVAGEGVLRTWGGMTENRLFFTAHDRQGMLLTVTDTFPAASALMTSDLILMSAPTFRTLTGVPQGMATDIAIRLGNPMEAETVARKVMERLPDTRAILKSDIRATYQALFDWRSGWAFLMLSGAFMGFVLLVWGRAGGLDAEERFEIGLLKAVGWSTADVMALKLYETSATAMAAFGVGVLLAYGHVFLFSGALFEPFFKGWAVLYPEFPLSPAGVGDDLAAVFGLWVLPYPLLSLVPTWRAAATEPDAALRLTG